MRSNGVSSAAARFGKMLAAAAVVLMICGCAGMSGSRQGGTDDEALRVWPKASSPPVYKAANGDRVGDYPPYYYPCH